MPISLVGLTTSRQFKEVDRLELKIDELMDTQKTTNTKTVYATYFDFGYLPRALTLFESLRFQGDKSEIWVLCLDEPTELFLSAHAVENVKIFSLSNLENKHKELLEVKPDRSRAEYIFTLGPTFLQEVFELSTRNGDVLVYLDADLYFFGDPQKVVKALGNSSVGIIEHRYPEPLERKLAKYGRFNVGWVGFKHDDYGKFALDWWAKECINWCFDTPDSGRYADQGYLDTFPTFQGVSVLTNPGFNLAPWNTGRHIISRNGQDCSASVDGEPLIFFHFHGIKETRNWFVTSQLIYGSPANMPTRNLVYKPYLSKLSSNQRLVSATEFNAKLNKQQRGRGLRGLLFKFRVSGLAIASVLSGNAFSKRSIL
ncbi:hypothetical protein [Aurantimicrobium minutum]|uniref:hypothetical protein n=1 Tax=Aurantimicrobium minutum TaxID=708131 RepID=UPI00247423E8|nr:hypothetical protein [Aurantimicrobium minutum]MDH6256032.1 hypothetical protein [Aurantimicrobium minutum]